MMVKGGVRATSVGNGKTVIVDRKQSPKLASKYGDGVAKAVQQAAEKGKALNKTALVALLTAKGSKLDLEKARKEADKIIGNAKKPSGLIGNPLKSKTSKMTGEDFLSQSWDTYKKKVVIDPMNQLLDKTPTFEINYSAQQYIESNRGKIDAFAQKYYDMIPKTNKDVFPKKKDLKPLIEAALEGEKNKSAKEALDYVVKNINEAVSKDRADWNKTPDLMGLKGRIKKESTEQKTGGSSLKPSIQKQYSGLKVLSDTELSALADEMSGASHKDIMSKLKTLFPVEDNDDSDEEVEITDKYKKAELSLAIMHQADIETEAKEGGTNLLPLLQRWNENKKIALKDDKKFQKLVDNFEYYGYLPDDIDAKAKAEKAKEEDVSAWFRPANEYLAELAEKKAAKEAAKKGESKDDKKE